MLNSAFGFATVFLRFLLRFLLLASSSRPVEVLIHGAARSTAAHANYHEYRQTDRPDPTRPDPGKFVTRIRSELWSGTARHGAARHTARQGIPCLPWNLSCPVPSAFKKCGSPAN